MKNFLFSLLLVSGVCKGQSLFLDSATLSEMGGSIRFTHNGMYDYNRVVGRDTVPVMLLVCDTTEAFWTTSVYYLNPMDRPFQNGHSVNWIKGYSVREKLCCINGNTSTYAVYQPVPYYNHLFYLDDEKKPLVNIMVWLAQ